MKYFPLVWAALWRKPASLILTLLSVTVAFTLFGVMVGFNASIQHRLQLTNLNRGYVSPRFGGNLPMAYKATIAQVPGVIRISAVGFLGGYFQDRKNVAFVLMEDGEAPDVLTDAPMTPAEWQALAGRRDGIFVSQLIATRYHLKPGDTYPILTTAVTRGDGGKLWPFQVLGIVDDVPRYLSGFAAGNFDYWDQSRPLTQQGTTMEFQVLFDSPDHAEEGVKQIDSRFANAPVPTNSFTDRDSSENAAAAGINIPFVTSVVAGAGIFMILFLTGNGIAQSVRERIPEFAMLKTLGFSNAMIIALVFAEAAIPCLLGAAIGIALANAFAGQVPHLFPPNVLALPPPYMSPAVLSLAFVFAILVAFVSTVLPALRIRRLDVAAALSGR